MSIVSNTTIDVITRGLIKYRLITHATADAIGSELIRLNHLASADDEGHGPAAIFYPYLRRPFERKVKRAALDGAILAWQAEIVGLAGSESMPVVQLVQRLHEKNLDRIQRSDYDYTSDTPVDVEDTDEGREAIMIRPRSVREEENRQRLQERLAAAAAERAANPQNSDDEDLDDEDDWDDDDVDGDE